jgi:hypothetical protein
MTRRKNLYTPLARCSTKSTSVDARIVSSDYTIWYPRVVARYLLEVQRGSPEAGLWARRARMLATGELKAKGAQ